MRRRKRKIPIIRRSPESPLYQVQLAKQEYYLFLQSHNLSPANDWTKHPKWGKEIKKLIARIQFERDKLELAYPLYNLTQIYSVMKLKKEKEEKAAKAKEAKPEKGTKKPKTTKKGKKAKAKDEKTVKVGERGHRLKYDYPLIDGREMTKDEKRKYRASQRSLKSKGDVFDQTKRHHTNSDEDNPVPEVQPKPKKKEKASTKETSAKKSKKKKVSDED